MSQSIRTPGGIAMRAVAAAALFSRSKADNATSRSAAEPSKDEENTQKPTLKAGLKPQPRR